jgi:phosphoribosylformylglycinamidine synthase
MDVGAMSRPEALVIAAPGTNRDPDVSFALERAGANVHTMLLTDLAHQESRIRDYGIIVLAGGFSYADALGAGRLFALEVEHAIGESLRQAVDAGTLVLGICNGFQALVRLGLLPGDDTHAALAQNDNGHFVCTWVRIRPTSTRCVWTKELDTAIDCPIAHGEGRFVSNDLAALDAGDHIAFRYASPNPNGSMGDVAGICDSSGRILGLMPHPENHVVARQSPWRHRGTQVNLGLRLFEEGVRHAR